MAGQTPGLLSIPTSSSLALRAWEPMRSSSSATTIGLSRTGHSYAIARNHCLPPIHSDTRPLAPLKPLSIAACLPCRYNAAHGCRVFRRSPNQHTVVTSSYIPADRDTDFLQRDELRPLRLGLELLKPGIDPNRTGHSSTIVVFGSARLSPNRRAPDRPSKQPRRAEDGSSRSGATTTRQGRRTELALAPTTVASRVRHLVSSTCQIDGQCDYVIVTGGARHHGSRQSRRGGCRRQVDGNIITRPMNNSPTLHYAGPLFSVSLFRPAQNAFSCCARALGRSSRRIPALDELFETLDPAADR